MANALSEAVFGTLLCLCMAFIILSVIPWPWQHGPAVVVEGPAKLTLFAQHGCVPSNVQLSELTSFQGITRRPGALAYFPDVTVIFCDYNNGVMDDKRCGRLDAVKDAGFPAWWLPDDTVELGVRPRAWIVGARYCRTSKSYDQNNTRSYTIMLRSCYFPTIAESIRGIKTFSAVATD